MSFTYQDSSKRVKDAASAANFRNFGHAAARISKDAKASIVTSDQPSPPGQPPHTAAERGHNIRGAIRYDATKDDAVIGPMFSWVGESAEAHEYGGEFRGNDYPARPTMEPALKRNKDRYAQEWAGSI